MKVCHNSSKLNRLLNKTVRIEFINGQVLTGVLMDRLGAIDKTNYNFLMMPYYLIGYGEIFGFYKSHVVRISEV